jgi:hypothetical protein
MGSKEGNGFLMAIRRWMPSLTWAFVERAKVSERVKGIEPS